MTKYFDLSQGKKKYSCTIRLDTSPLALTQKQFQTMRKLASSFLLNQSGHVHYFQKPLLRDRSNPRVLSVHPSHR